MGKKGRKNCRVMGRRSEKRIIVEMAVLASGPGDCMTLKEKMPMIRSNKYWKSYTVHR